MKTARQSKYHRVAMPAMASLAVAMILGGSVVSQAQVVKGSGTASTIPVWTSGTMVGNSVLKQSGGNVTVSGGVTATGSINASSFTGNGAALSNVNAATLGGVAKGAFAQLGLSNTFTADQAINGNLNLMGLINNALTVQGNLTESTGGFYNGFEGANVTGGFAGSAINPPNSVAAGLVGATIAGGGGGNALNHLPNTVTADWGTVGGGARNTASGDFSTVGGGALNTASGDVATVAGGTGNTASGFRGTVPGGERNTAAGAYSFAAGYNSTAQFTGSFVWSDNSSAIGISDTTSNQFLARAGNGFVFYTTADSSIGATLAAGSGSWSSFSDKNAKSNFSGVDGQSLLAKLATLPISTWNYKAQPESVRHMGPMAQDFRAAFGLGEDERHISTVDAQGVALAAIQALYETVTELKKSLGDKDQQIVELRARLEQLEHRR